MGCLGYAFPAVTVPLIAANTQDTSCSFSLPVYIFHSSWLKGVGGCLPAQECSSMWLALSQHRDRALQPAPSGAAFITALK